MAPISRRQGAAFSLLEVLVATAILSVGLVTIIGLHAAVVRPMAATTDAEIAARIGDAVRARLLSLPTATARALIQDSNEAMGFGGSTTAPVPIAIPRQLFGTRYGEIGVYAGGTDGSGWRDSSGRLLAEGELTYAIDLIRNEELSPLAEDLLSSCVVFTIRIRWPALRPESASSIEGVRYVSAGWDRQEVLSLAGSLAR